jgi:GT2 family glycosyltransferase
MARQPAPLPHFGVVVLTMGRRPDDLDRGLRSILAQEAVTTDVVVVGNSWQPVDLPQGVRGHGLPENVGIPAGRNAGVPLVTGDLLLFLDDDAALPDPHFLRTLADRFAADARLGLVQPRVVDPTGRPAPRRWVPRLRVGNPYASSPATALWEGAVVMRRSLFEAVGGWPDEFFYAHEGIDLVWRVWDEGYVPWYAADLVANHPVIDPARHDVYYRLNARNRVWLARRNLPVVLEPLYVGTWVAMTLLRVHDRDALGAWFGGLREGMVQRPAGRRPMKWKTVWAMTKAGRPPII